MNHIKTFGKQFSFVSVKSTFSSQQSFNSLKKTNNFNLLNIQKNTLSNKRFIGTHIERLPFDWKNGLLPVFSPRTLDIQLNNIVRKDLRLITELVKGSELQNVSLVELIRTTADNASDTTLHSHACSLWNHQFALQTLIPGGRKPSEQLVDLINLNFHSMEGLKKKMKIHANALVGNGFVWLVDHKGTLEIVATPNYSTPLIWSDTLPILGLNLWQHSYFLDHKDDIDGYIDGWFRVVNWEVVQQNLAHVGELPKEFDYVAEYESLRKQMNEEESAADEQRKKEAQQIEDRRQKKEAQKKAEKQERDEMERREKERIDATPELDDIVKSTRK